MQVCRRDKAHSLMRDKISIPLNGTGYSTHLPLSRASASFTRLFPSFSCAAHSPKTHTLYSLDFIWASLISRGFNGRRKKTRVWGHYYWLIQIQIQSRQLNKFFFYHVECLESPKCSHQTAVFIVLVWRADQQWPLHSSFQGPGCQKMKETRLEP